MSYQLGSAEDELARLGRQARALAPATRILLTAAGLGPGMRVLDLGSGAGDMALLAASIVGPDGEVVGIDQSPDAVETAAARAPDNVRFTVGDVREPASGGPFDAVIGRLVLMYVPDPAAALRAQATTLKPGGLVAPIELDLATAGAVPDTPLVTQARTWLRETFARAGIAPDLGSRLWQVQLAAGLEPQGMLGVQPRFGPVDPDGAFLLAGIVRALLPVIERTGVATAAEVDAPTLERRVAEELEAHSAVFAHPTLLTAWARKP
jgi:SAM-dependent methyltransferase